ncbi:hypothetical protein KRR55_14365 [Paeniglutamicibacter sp. ABSL32-1]|uniref:hypothetical protein n=1 Tax=Paeniglutamicibacter quisquiliarum TaxID=2849498 RepID=UPI001C2D3EDE|nr:hypothetical protein [Paeniglutamicibacter quisquiliarum]MBV1780298.1 hypothetical protein [Paeniglutamicibacter quisquiliarum]
MPKDFERWDVLVRDRQRIGVLYRNLESNVLLTRVLVEDDVEPYRAESRVRLDPAANSWELSWFRDRSMDQARLMRREPQGSPVDSMPSFADILMVMRAIEDPENQMVYWRLNEAGQEALDPGVHPPAEPNAHIRRVGPPEELSIPLGTTLTARRFEAWADGLLVATHWVNADNELVCTRWGASLTAFGVPGDPSDAGWLSLSGLDDSTVDFMTHGFGDGR